GLDRPATGRSGAPARSLCSGTLAARPAAHHLRRRRLRRPAAAARLRLVGVRLAVPPPLLRRRVEPGSRRRRADTGRTRLLHAATPGYTRRRRAPPQPAR